MKISVGSNLTLETNKSNPAPNWIMHRDLKPGNMVIDAGGVIKLIDFNSAKIYGPRSRTGKTSCPGQAKPHGQDRQNLMARTGKTSCPGQAKPHVQDIQNLIGLFDHNNLIK